MIGEAELRMMKPDSVLVNTARGGLVDEEALVRALSEGWISAAGIDVYENLPMFDPDPAYVHHPLFDLDNVILTPHSAGTSIESSRTADALRSARSDYGTERPGAAQLGKSRVIPSSQWIKRKHLR